MSDSPPIVVAPPDRSADSRDRLLQFFFAGLSCILLVAAVGLTVGLIVQSPPPDMKWTAYHRAMAVASLLIMYLAGGGVLLERSRRPRIAAAGRWSLRLTLPLLWAFLLVIFARGLFARPADEPYVRGAAAFFMYLLVVPAAGLVLNAAGRSRRRAEMSAIDQRSVPRDWPAAAPSPQDVPSARDLPSARDVPAPAPIDEESAAAAESLWAKLLAAPVFLLCLPILLVARGGISQLMIGLMFLVVYGGLPFWGELAGAAFGRPLLGSACGAAVLMSGPIAAVLGVGRKR